MQIDQIKSTKQIKPAKKTKQTSASSSFADLFEELESLDAPKNIVNIQKLANLQGLISIQEYERKEKDDFKNHSDKLIDNLRSIQISLLDEDISLNELNKLKNLIEKDYYFTDPKIINLLNQLKLRACVELAKYSS